MANNYRQCAATEELKCSKAEAQELANLLESGDENLEDAGFDFEYDGTSLYLYAEEFGDENCLPQDFRTKLGELISKNGVDYLEVGYAFTCSKMRMGEFGGGTFRIMSDGSLVYPTIVWEPLKDDSRAN